MARKASDLDTARPATSASPRVLITAGPTHEPIDAVRYIANRSSGRMGLALAQACAARGWPSTLLLGPVPMPQPDSSHITVHRFQTAADLAQLLLKHWPQHDVLFMAAAVADFTPATPKVGEKLKRTDQPLTLTLRPTPDLLASLASITRPDQMAVGFALESPDDLLRSAKSKLRAKNLDAIIANPLETMDSERVTATVLLADGRSIGAEPGISKAKFASWILDVIAPLAQAKGHTAVH